MKKMKIERKWKGEGEKTLRKTKQWGDWEEKNEGETKKKKRNGWNEEREREEKK